MAKSSSVGTKVGLGAAALAAAAATYYFYGKDGKKHRQAAGTWSKKAKADMLQKIKGMKTMSKQAYEQAAKEVVAKYKQIKNIDPKELAILGAELKSQWDNISKQASKLGQKEISLIKKKVSPTKKPQARRK